MQATAGSGDLQSLIADAVLAARRAGAAILEVYGTEFAVDLKRDKTPLTEADRRSTAIIEEILESSTLPILSEEGRHTPFAERREWQWSWLVDPLDGTKEFVKRNGDFTVNIALIHAGAAVGGLVFVPVTSALYFALEGCGAYRTEVSSDAHAQIVPWSRLTSAARRLPLAVAPRPFTIVASRSHLSRETEAYIAKAREEHGTIDIVSRGSSLKLCMIAEGVADEYPRFAPTMEWDTAAGHAIVKEAGGAVYEAGSRDELRYNKEDLTNPWFLAQRLRLNAPDQ